MSESIHETIKEIKKDFRLSMNGVVSTIQRRQGLGYKINFGVEIPRLKAIAGKYQQSEELAMTLWKDDIRECKILAIYLLPEESYPAVAETWIEETKYTEIAERLAMHMLCKLPDAAEKALQWTNMENGIFNYCGYMTLSHIFRNGVALDTDKEQQFFNNVADLVATERGSTLQRCAINTLFHYIEADEEREERLEATLQENGKSALLELLL